MSQLVPISVKRPISVAAKGMVGADVPCAHTVESLGDNTQGYRVRSLGILVKNGQLFWYSEHGAGFKPIKKQDI